MRALALAGLVCACGSPGTDDHTWPPYETITAVASSDIDDDGDTDVFALSDSATYEVRGGVDLGPHPSPIRSYSKAIDANGAGRAAIICTGPGGERLLVTARARGDTSLDIEVRRGVSLEKTSSFTIPTDGESVWMTSGSGLLFIGSGTRAWLLEVAELLHSKPSQIEVPSPGASWTTITFAATYVSGPDAFIVVASSTEAYRARIPEDRSSFVWESIRQGPAWLGQTTVDINRDGHPELVGLDPSAPPTLCTLEVTTQIVRCMRTISNEAYADVSILGGSFDAPTRTDIFVVHSRPTGQAYDLFGDVTLGVSALVATTAEAPVFRQGTSPIYLIPVFQAERAVPWVVQLDSSGLFEYCYRVTNGEVQSCP